MLIRALEHLALTLWAGGLWVTGYLVTPLLYRHFEDTVTAATVSGELSAGIAWLSLACAAVLIPAQLRHSVRPLAAHWRLWLMVIMLGLVTIGEFWVRPDMAGLDPEALAAESLAALRASESMYLVASVIALALVLGGVQSSPSSCTAEQGED